MLPVAVDFPALALSERSGRSRVRHSCCQAVFLSGALVEEELLDPESEELLDVLDLSLFDDVDPVDVLDELPSPEELVSPDETDELSPELDEVSLGALSEELDGLLLLVA